MDMSFETTGAYQVIAVSGVVDSTGAGRLLDALVEATLNGGDRLIVDLSGVRSMTRAGARGFVVAAKLSITTRGAMRICGATPSVETVLRGLGHHYLLRFDRTVEASLEALSGHAVRRAA